jgi:hypothetical protein
MAGAGIQSFAKFHAQTYTAECQGLKTVEQFVAFRGKFRAEPFDLWRSAVKFYQGVGIPQYIGEWWLAFRSPLRAVCQDVIPVVAIRGQRTAELGK